MAARPRGRDGEGPAAVRLHAVDQRRLGSALPQLPPAGHQVGGEANWSSGASQEALEDCSGPRAHPQGLPPTQAFFCPSLTGA